MTKTEYNKQYYLKNKEKILKQQEEYYKKNKEKINERNRKWLKEHNEQGYSKELYHKHREQKLEAKKKYNSTKIGRAVNLCSTYAYNDRNKGRGECTITPEWIVENIFTSKCRYCGKDDWSKLGCDRIYNDLPHTEDNVVPCCEKCNRERGCMDYEEFIKKIKGRH